MQAAMPPNLDLALTPNLLYKKATMTWLMFGGVVFALILADLVLNALDVKAYRKFCPIIHTTTMDIPERDVEAMTSYLHKHLASNMVGSYDGDSLYMRTSIFWTLVTVLYPVQKIWVSRHARTISISTGIFNSTPLIVLFLLGAPLLYSSMVDLFGIVFLVLIIFLMVLFNILTCRKRINGIKKFIATGDY